MSHLWPIQVMKLNESTLIFFLRFLVQALMFPCIDTTRVPLCTLPGPALTADPALTPSHEKKIGHRDCSRWAHCDQNSPWANGGPRAHPPSWSSVSGTILFRGASGIILAMLPEKKNWDSLPILAIFQNGHLKIWDFQYLGNYFM